MNEADEHPLDDLLSAAITSGNVDETVRLLAVGASPNGEVDVDLYGFGSKTVPMLELAMCWHLRRDLSKRRSSRIFSDAGVHEGINIEIVKALVDAGADVNPADADPLIIAANFDEWAVAEYLLDHGADPNRFPRPVQSPLGVAVVTHSFSVVHVLLIHGADPNQVSLTKTPLQWFRSVTGYRRMVDSALLRANPNRVGKRPSFLQNRSEPRHVGGETNPEWSMPTRARKIVRLLIEHGAVR